MHRQKANRVFLILLLLLVSVHLKKISNVNYHASQFNFPNNTNIVGDKIIETHEQIS